VAGRYGGENGRYGVTYKYCEVFPISHRLPVEIGRYKKIAYCVRKCKNCDQGEVGNEQHYQVSCGNTMFTFLRQNFIKSVYKINQSFKYFDTQSLFQYILSMKDSENSEKF
jgi:hypothetical protein